MMKMLLLSIETLWELLVYDLVRATAGFKTVHAMASRAIRHPAVDADEVEKTVLQGVAVGMSFCWKPVLCLQRAVVTARVLRRHGIKAEVVIGCRPAPFVGHAWVEAGGRVLNDSRGYQQKLCVLDRF